MLAPHGDVFEGGPGNDDIYSRDGKRDVMSILGRGLHALTSRTTFET